MENTLAQMTQQVAQFVEMRTQTDSEPTSQIDGATLWNGEEVKESTNEVSNSKIIFDDFYDEDDNDFESLIDPYASQEINMCENSCDSNDGNFLDDSFCMLFDEGNNISVVEIDLNKDIVNSNVVDEIQQIWMNLTQLMLGLRICT